MLPLLTVLFLISYGLMVLLVVEQNRTIASQHWLITELMSDSKELMSLKGKLLNEKRNRESHAGTPQAQAPSTQAAPSHKNNTRRLAPERPPRLTSDAPDARRRASLI